MTRIEIPIPPSKEEIKSIFLECLEEYHAKVKPSDYSKKQFSKLIDKSESWIDSQRRQGNISWFMRGGEVRIKHSELEKLQN